MSRGRGTQVPARLVPRRLRLRQDVEDQHLPPAHRAFLVPVRHGSRSGALRGEHSGRGLPDLRRSRHCGHDRSHPRFVRKHLRLLLPHALSEYLWRHHLHPGERGRVRPGGVLLGTTRSFINVVAVVIALIFLGRMPLIWTPAVLALALVGGINFGAMSLLVTSKVKQTEYFNFFLTLVIFPAEFVTGAFFPVERLPDFLEPVAWVIPLTSLIDLIRGMALGTLSSTSLLELAYVLISTVALVELALRSMRHRLIS